VTILTSSYLCIVYTHRVISNVIINGPFRRQLAGKIDPGKMLANGFRAKGLTIKEYLTVAALGGFPAFPLPPIIFPTIIHTTASCRITP
jgi:hypothetical protein